MSMYHQDQTKRLGDAKRFAVKFQNRDTELRSHGAETHWLSINPDQFQRIVDILTEGDTTYEIQPTDVGKTHLRAFGQDWPVVDFLGMVRAGDVGKRVYKMPVDAGDSFILQVESDEQRDARQSR